MSDLVGKSFGVRFPADVQQKIQENADKHGLTQTEVIRNATTKQLMQPSLEYLIKQLEKRLLQKSFEINCVISALNEVEREKAITYINAALKQKVLQ
jgi:hypothetical protein